jgi:hypothetical protein
MKLAIAALQESPHAAWFDAPHAAAARHHCEPLGEVLMKLLPEGL